MNSPSIFETYYSEFQLHDRYLIRGEVGVTVIIPTIHTNELWRANLHSIYREIPVAQLLIGDGGCEVTSIEIAKEFPRVTIQDHRIYKSLGYSIRKLIESVETEWFIYLHSDVYLPEGWFNEMSLHKGEYDWFGSKMRHTVLIEYDHDYAGRPYAGSQMGKKSAFLEGLGSIEDDYVYRQEDFVFADLIAKNGYREGKIDSTFHYHQTIKKPSPFWNPSNVKVEISQTLNRDEEIRVWESQAKGIIKYLMPTSRWLIESAGYGVYRLDKLNYISLDKMYDWILEVNPAWMPDIKRQVLRLRLLNLYKWTSEFLRKFIKPFLGQFRSQ